MIVKYFLLSETMKSKWIERNEAQLGVQLGDYMVLIAHLEPATC